MMVHMNVCVFLSLNCISDTVYDYFYNVSNLTCQTTVYLLFLSTYPLLLVKSISNINLNLI